MTLAQMWLSYMDQVVPKGASAIQISECKRAFYAGAVCVLETMKVIGEPHISEETGMEILEGLTREGAAFVASVGKEN